MKKRMTAVTALLCAGVMTLTGCSGEISNEYITISKYKGVEVEKVEVPEVTDEEVDNEIQAMLDSGATYTEVTDRPAQDGDEVTIDFVGKLDGVAFENGSAEDTLLTLGSNSFIDGFEDGIIGHSIGETFDLNLTFPEDYGSAELAGKDVVFTVTLDAISEVTTPELTDEWVMANSTTSKTVEEYKTETRTQIEEFYAQNVKETLMSSAWEAVVANTTVNTYPSERLQTTIAMYIAEQEKIAESYGMTMEELLEQYQMDEDTFNAQISTMSKEHLRDVMIAELIADKAGIDISEDAVNKFFEENGYLEYYACETVEEFRTLMEEESDMDLLEELVRMNLVQQWLADNCKQVEAAAEDTEEGSEE